MRRSARPRLGCERRGRCSTPRGSAWPPARSTPTCTVGRCRWSSSLAGSDGADLNLRRHYIDAALRSDRDAIDALQRTEEDLAASERGLRDARQAAQQSVERVQTNRDAGGVERGRPTRRTSGGCAASSASWCASSSSASSRPTSGVRSAPVGSQPPPAPPTAAGGRGRRARADDHGDVGAPDRTGAPPSPPGGIWACIREKESGNNYRAPGGGAYQFQLATWQSLGGTGLPEDAAPPVQDEMAIMLQQRSGWGQWSTAEACGAY